MNKYENDIIQTEQSIQQRLNKQYDTIKGSFLRQIKQILKSQTIKNFNAAVLSKIDNLAKHHARIVDLPKINEYMASNRLFERKFHLVGPRFRWQ